MAETKVIYCPKCGRKAFTWDGKQTINIAKKCDKCNKLVIYDIATDKAEIKPIPPRAESSGMRFY